MLVKVVFFIFFQVLPGVEPPEYEPSQLFLSYAECVAYREQFPEDAPMSACFPITLEREAVN